MALRNRQLMAAAIGLICLANLAGCGQPALRIASPEAKLPAGEGSAEFIDRIASSPTVSQNDAMRGILLLLDGKDEAETFQQRVERLRDKNIISAGWSFQSDRAITRGKLAYMIFQACDMSGGALVTLAGPSQRYCLRELQYKGFVSRGSWFCEVNGPEFVAVLTRADSYLETGGMPEVIAIGQGQ